MVGRLPPHAVSCSRLTSDRSQPWPPCYRYLSKESAPCFVSQHALRRKINAVVQTAFSPRLTERVGTLQRNLRCLVNASSSVAMPSCTRSTPRAAPTSFQVEAFPTETAAPIMFWAVFAGPRKTSNSVNLPFGHLVNQRPLLSFKNIYRCTSCEKSTMISKECLRSRKPHKLFDTATFSKPLSHFAPSLVPQPL